MTAAAPAPPRPAATVVLVRAGGGGACEVYLQKRAETLRFAPGRHVFPGGAVDAADGSREAVQRVTGAGAWACDPDVTAAHVVAALRECYEESGVLVARDADGRPVHAHPEQAARLAAARAGVEGPGGAAAFVGILERERLWLEGDALRYFAHWITPVTSPIRFDARFFLARVPEGAEPSPASGESVEGGWWAPGAALAAAAARRIKLPEPTEVTVRFLAQFGSCAALLAHCGDGTLKIQGTTHLIWPGDGPGLHRD